MSTIGFIGSGKVGTALARLAVDAGHDVALSNRRGPRSLVDLVQQVGPRARAVTVAEAAADTDIVVLAVPLAAYPLLPTEPLRAKVVLDTANYKPDEHPGHLPDVDLGHTTPYEVTQHHLPESFVVKALSNMFFKHLAQLSRPAGAADRSVLPIAGDDPTAKATVATLLDSLGYDSLDIGALVENRRFAVFGAPANQAHLDPDGGFTAPGRPVTADRLRQLLDQVD